MPRLSKLYFFLGMAVSLVLTPMFVFASDDSYGLEATADAAKLTKYGNSVPDLIGNVIGTALSLISVIFFVLMIYGGLRWMISRGNEDQSKKALDTIIAAIIGIIIVLASYAITTFVFNSVKPANSTTTNTQTQTQIQTTSVALGGTCGDGLPSCASNLFCTDGLESTGICVALPGGNCTADNLCRTGKCENGTCVVPEGQLCDVGPCASGLTCVNSICAASGA